MSYQGDVLGLLTTEGELAATYLYDAWGNLLEDELTLIGSLNPLRYRSYYYDSDLSLYYLQSRYYDSTTGRFISTDSTDYLDLSHLQGMNLYTYGLNNPVMHTDPSGRFVFSLFFACVIGFMVLGGLTAGMKAYSDGLEGWDLVGAIALGAMTGAIIGAGVGIVAGLQGVYLIGGLASLSGKLIEDFFAYSVFGTPIGTWEDYAIAFISGGLTAKMGLKLKVVIDVMIRPIANQLVKIGTMRQRVFQLDKLSFDIITRATTFFIPPPWKPFFRAINRGFWDSYSRGLLKPTPPVYLQML